MSSAGRIENWYCCAKYIGQSEGAFGVTRGAGGAELSLIRKAAHDDVVEHTRITAPLPSIAIVVIAIVMIVEVEPSQTSHPWPGCSGHMRIMLVCDRVWQVVAAARREKRKASDRSGQ